MKFLIKFVCSVFLLSACDVKEEMVSKNDEKFIVHVEFETSLGSFIIDVDLKRAPHTGQAFINQVEEGFYDNSSFYRIVKEDNDTASPIIEVIQGGVGFEEEQSTPNIPHESTKDTGILHTDGTISMVPGPTGHDFFITIGNQHSLDFGGLRREGGQGFAAFGKIRCGRDIVAKIHAAETGGITSRIYAKEQVPLNRLAIMFVRKLEVDKAICL